MEPTYYSYLDLTVMPFLRKKVISGDAALLFTPQFNRVLWANAMGADLFGGDDIFGLLDIELSPTHSLVRQLHNASQQIDASGPVVRGFRVARGLKSDLVQGELSRIVLPDDSEAFLLVFEGGHKAARLREHELAAMAVEALEGFADAAAVVDEYGLIIASTRGFDRLGIDPDTLEALIGIVAKEDDRLVKRKVETASGTQVAAGLGRIRDVPGRFLIVMADAEDGHQEEDIREEPAPVSGAGVFLAGSPAGAEEAEEKPDTEAVEAPEPSNGVSAQGMPRHGGDETADEASGEPDNTPIETPTDEPVGGANDEPVDETGVEAAHDVEDASSSLLDRWYFSGEDKAADTARNDQIPPPETTETATAESDVSPEDMAAAPVRFAFSIDENQVIQSASPELMATVGEKSGDIIGKNWTDIAAQRNFDEDGAIHALLMKADTWSGKSVHWPIDDTDMVVPVDMAALPAFDRDRNFNGFRGFGIIRVNDAIVDPSATGLNLADVSEENEPEPGEAEEGGPSYWQTDIANEDEAVEEDTQMPDPGPGSTQNVFHLPTRNGHAARDGHESDDTETLSGREQEAFSQISKSLADQIEEDHLNEDDEDQVTSGDDNSPSARTDIVFDDSVLHTLPVPLVIYSPEQLQFANEALLNLAGYDAVEDISEAGGVDALLGGSGDNTLPAETRDGTATLIHSDGREIAVNSRLTTVKWQGKNALCLTFVPSDSSEGTDEKAAFDMIRVSELENILETAADGILVFDENGKILSLNASGEALFGRSQDDVAGTSFGKLFATESRQALEAYVKDLNTPGVSGVLAKGREVIGLEAGGGLIPLFATIGKVGGSGRYCAVLRDLTDWKKSEEELVQAKRNAETASEQKTEFLSRISHEIREPLTAIIGFSDVMIEGRFGEIENERYREYLKDINRSGVHVLDLVNDLLDISKIEAGKLELSYEAVDLNQLAAETVALLQPQANNKRILIRTSLSRAVPKVVADARSIRQIILNLVSNAINHSPANSQVIVSTTYEENSEVGLRIRDTGSGMSKEQLERATEPFSQVGDDRMGNGGGTGLGLPLTKALVEANRAYFELESTPGEGTIAHIQFPSQRVLAD